jgi:hypothetical protein
VKTVVNDEIDSDIIKLFGNFVEQLNHLMIKQRDAKSKNFIPGFH